MSMEKNPEFPPDDETNKRSDKQIKSGGVKALNKSQIEFIFEKAKQNQDLIKSIKDKLDLPDDQKTEMYLADEVRKFEEFCEGIGVSPNEYSIAMAFFPIFNFVNLKSN